jgi:predicted RNA-binding protein YlxR (DUF448 family)
MKEKAELLRVVKTPEGGITIDAGGKASGRGAYLCRNRKCYELAKKNKGLERSLKTYISQELLNELQQEL